MLFLLQGKHGSLVRTILGAVLLIAGLLLGKGMLILVAVGAVLLVWGVVALVGEQTSGHRRARRNIGRQR